MALYSLYCTHVPLETAYSLTWSDGTEYQSFCAAVLFN